MMSSLSRLVLAAPLLAGCFVDKPPADSGATDDGTASTGGTGPGQSTSTVSASEPTMATVSDADPTISGTGATAPGSTATGDPTASACGDVPDRPLDSECTDETGCGCQSGTCFVLPIVGGLCGECTGDRDCGGGGCTMPDPINSVGSRCNQGEPGAGCETDSVCSEPLASRCGDIYIIPGLFEVRTCGVCSSAADCFVDAPNCSPVYDVGHLTGFRACVADSSLEDGQGCSLTPGVGGPEGNVACISGFCTPAKLQDVVELGVCGACSSDKDCLLGQTCSPATADAMTGTLTGSKCV